MSDAQKRLQELVESLEASMNSLGGSAYPLIDAKTLVRALVLTLDTFEELSRDPDPEVTKRMHSLEASVKAIGMSMQGYEMAAVEDESSDKNAEPEIDPFEYTRQVQERMDQMEKKNAEEKAAHEQQLEAARQQAAQAVAAGEAAAQDAAAARQQAQEAEERAAADRAAAAAAEAAAALAAEEAAAALEAQAKAAAEEARLREEGASAELIAAAAAAAAEAVAAAERMAAEAKAAEEAQRKAKEEAEAAAAAASVSAASGPPSPSGTSHDFHYDDPDAAKRHAKREEMKAKRKRARDRWHKAMRMVSRANRVKKITGMIKFVPPAKGQSLNERLQTLENASRKNTSAIARMENSIEALNDSVRNLVQNVTGIDEKIEKAAPKKPSATSKLKGLSRLTTPSKVSRTSSMNSEAMLAASPPSPGEMGKNMSPEELLELTHEVADADGDVGEETAMLYAVAVQQRMEKPEAREARLKAEALNPRLRAQDRWHRAIQVVQRMNHVRKMNRGALHTRAEKGQSVVEQLHHLEAKVLRDEAISKRRIEELEMSIKYMAENIQGFSSELHTWHDESMQKWDAAQFAKEQEEHPEADKLSPEEIKVRAKKRWKKAISIVKIGVRLGGSQGLLKSSKNKGPSLMDRIKQLEKDMTKLVIQSDDKIKSQQDKLSGKLPSIFELQQQAAAKSQQLEDALQQNASETQALRDALAALQTGSDTYATIQVLAKELSKRDGEIRKLTDQKADKNELLDMAERKADRDQMNPLKSKLTILEEQFLEYTQGQEATLQGVVSQLIEAYLAQAQFPSADTVAMKVDVEAQLAKVATTIESLFTGKADKLALTEALGGKADKRTVDDKADASTLEAVQAFFKSKLAELAALSEGSASEDDLKALRAALEKEFKSTMADHFAKKEEDKALATSRCLTCGQATNEQVPVVGAYAANRSQLRPRGPQNKPNGFQYSPAPDKVYGGGFQIPGSGNTNNNGSIASGRSSWGAAVPQIHQSNASMTSTPGRKLTGLAGPSPNHNHNHNTRAPGAAGLAMNGNRALPSPKIPGAKPLSPALDPGLQEWSALAVKANLGAI